MDQSTIYSLLKSLRGNRTQIEMSKILGYQDRAYHHWEIGQKKIRVKEFVKICDLNQISFKNILKDSLNLLEVGSFKSDTINNITNSWNLSEEEFLKRSGLSKSKWWRLKNENKDLLLIDLFTIIKFHTEKSDIVFESLGLTNYLNEKRDLLFKYFKKYEYLPFLSASILLEDVLNESNSEKKIRLISQKIGQSFEETKTALNSLIEDGLLRIKIDGNYEFITFEHHIDGLHREVGQFIFDNIMKNLNQTKKNHFSYRVAPISNEAYKKIQELQKKFSSEVYNILASDDGKIEHIFSIGIKSSIENPHL
ncbi:MAG: hypothetical protein H6622_07020 [Halobacteriovoraceae bacterium]|nr:hypothetical protein [Halobacteriovoraceae bacterium]